MKLNDWLCITDGRVTEGSEFGFQYYGERAYSLSYWNQMHGADEVSSHVVYDRSTFEVYDVEVYDGAREITYIWSPNRAAYEAELKASNPTYFCEWTEVVLESLEDFVEKATAIINGEDYDNRVKVPINFDDSELLALMMEAHRRDITFNELVELGIRQAIDAELDKGEKPKSDWPFEKDNDTFRKMLSRVIWVNGETYDFIGLWNTIKDLEVIDCSNGQFTGGVVSCTYDAHVYTYEVIWYNGDTDRIPDEIIREDK